MAIRATGFKPRGPQGSRLALSCRGFLANLSDSPRKAPEVNQRHQTRTIAMIDQQIEIATKDGHTTTFITHPERGGPFPVIIFYPAGRNRGGVQEPQGRSAGSTHLPSND